MSQITEAEARKRFKDHVAVNSEAQSHLGTVTVIEWAKPGTWVDHIRYFIHGATLMVYGDLGEAVYRWSGKLSLPFLAGCNLDYFRSKCQASEYGRGGKEWDEDAARENLQYYIDDAISEFLEFNEHRGKDGRFKKRPKCTAQEFIDSFTCEEALHNQFEWNRVLIDNDHQRMLIPGTTAFSNKDGKRGIFISLEERWDIGMVPAYRLQLHLWGLKLANEQCERRLSAEEMQKL